MKKSDYFGSLPYDIQESVLRSGIVFENDEEINMYVSGIKEKSQPTSFFNHTFYFPGDFGWFWPFF